jgi:hypothetical protein
MTKEPVFINKEDLISANWSALFSKLSTSQISRILRGSQVDCSHCDQWLADIGRSVKRGIEVEDNDVRYL